MDELVHLIYCSRASEGLSPSAIMRMVQQAQDRNHRDGITGMLLFGHGCFLQLIEGRRRSVSDLYHRIVRDGRHSDLLLIDFAAKQERDFSKWGMGLYDVARSRDGQIAAIRGDRFDPFAFGRARSLQVLQRASECLDSES